MVSRRDVRDWFIHLRLIFQILLSPIFLWAYLLAGGQLAPTFFLGYVAFHLFGYAGGTAFNSCYDRDTGPIGGLEHPPPIPRGLLAFSLVWQAIGFGMALLVGPVFAAIYAVMFCLSVAYSHPRIRFKGRPLAALFTVALGQGVLAFLGGWSCARGEIVSAFGSPAGWLGLIGITLSTVGFYPLTEIYQIAEDTQRGDLTLAAWLGPAGTFRFALVVLSVGGVALVWVIVMRYALIEAVVLALWLSGVLLAIQRWSQSFGVVSIVANFRTLMRLYAVTSLGFIGWAGLHLLGIL